MLELRPSCEHCNRLLPPESPDARICSFECTFCEQCVEMLGDVCPNCGGGFERRPVRPRSDWRNGNFLGNFPPSPVTKHRPVDLEGHARLVAKLGTTPPRDR